MLSIFQSSPMLDKTSGDLEQDFYRAFDRRTKSTLEGMEYTHPSRVQFVYPGEDVVKTIDLDKSSLPSNSDVFTYPNKYINMSALRLAFRGRRRCSVMT
jgi:hypothetical protein